MSGPAQRGGEATNAMETGHERDRISTGVDVAPSRRVASDRARADPGPAPVNTVLGGKYRVDQLVGLGGFGAVYRGWHLLVDVPVAIKIALPADATLAGRLRREAQTLMTLRHPHIVRVYDFGEDDGRIYMVQELIDGRPLDAVVEALGPLDPAVVVRIALQTLDALDAAHRRGVVHRDVKPGNLMVQDGPDGVAVQLVDFGAAETEAGAARRVTPIESGAPLGTPAYVAPEQIQGRGEPASDLYALGGTLFRLLTGRDPYPVSAPAVYRAHLEEPVPTLPPAVPEALAAVVRRALAKRPADRFASAASMAAALRVAGAELPPADPAPLVGRVPAVAVERGASRGTTAATVVSCPAAGGASVAAPPSTSVSGVAALVSVASDLPVRGPPGRRLLVALALTASAGALLAAVWPAPAPTSAASADRVPGYDSAADSTLRPMSTTRPRGRVGTRPSCEPMACEPMACETAPPEPATPSAVDATEDALAQCRCDCLSVGGDDLSGPDREAAASSGRRR